GMLLLVFMGLSAPALTLSQGQEKRVRAPRRPMPQPAMPVQGPPEGAADGKPAAGPEGKPAASPDEKAETAPEPIKTNPRPLKPAVPANPEELKVRPDGGGQVRFNFQGQAWLDVLEWLARISDLSLDWQELPADFLNLRTQRGYTVDE